MGGDRHARMKSCIIALTSILIVISLAPGIGAAGDAVGLGAIRGLIEDGEYSKAIERLIALRSRRPPQNLDNRALYLLGHASAKAGNYAEAIQHFSRAALVYDEMADYAMYNIAKTLALAGDHNRAAPTYRKIRSSYPASRIVSRALIGEAESLLTLGGCAEAGSVIDKLIDRYPESESAPALLEMAALCYEKSGALDKAFPIYKKIYIDYPASAPADAAGQKLNAIAAKKGLQTLVMAEREAIARAIGLYRAGLYEKAAAEFKPLAQTSSSASMAAAASFKFADSLKKLGRRAEAYSAFIEYADRFPAEPDAAEALYNALAVSLRDRSYDRAAELLEKIARLYPRHNARAKSLLAMGAYAEKEGQFKRALAHYRKLSSNYKGSPLAAEALWRSGWIEYTSGNYKEVEKEFQQIARHYPGSPYELGAIFWAAYSYEKQKAKKKAIPLYSQLVPLAQFSYYGAAAKDRLKRLGAPRAADTFYFGGSSQPDDPSQAHDKLETVPEERFHIIRVLELTALGFSADAYEELRLLEGLFPAERRYMIYLGKLYRDSRFPREAIKLLSSVLYDLSIDERKKLPKEFWAMLYPRDFWDEALKYSKESGLDPYLVLSIIRQESAFDSKAISSSGALGLMQIMPSTGKSLIAKKGLDSFDVNSLFDSELNISLGAGYFADLLKSNGRSLPLALASYNAGSGRVKSWLKKAGGASQEEFIEFIPFNETRNYVKNVLRNYTVYQLLYGRD